MINGATIAAWLASITAWQVIRWLATYATVIGSLSVGGWTVIKPRAEDFVKSTVQAEKFATIEQLNKQSQLLEELTDKFEEQNKVLDQQNTQMGIVQNDLGTVKTLQRDTLRAILKLAPDE